MAKYFCSFTWKRFDDTKAAPFFMAAAFAARSKSTFSETGTSRGFFWMGVFQTTSPTPGVGASFTGSFWNFELAFATATAVLRGSFHTVGGHVVGGCESPGTVYDHPHANAIRFEAGDALYLVFASVDELVEVTADADVGIGGTGRFGGV